MPPAKKAAPATTPEAKTEDTGPVGTKLPKDESPSAPKQSDWVLFVSTDKESVSFNIGPFPSFRWEGERLAWRIPADKAGRYDAHHFVVSGRVRREQVSI